MGIFSLSTANFRFILFNLSCYEKSRCQKTPTLLLHFTLSLLAMTSNYHRLCYVNASMTMSRIVQSADFSHIDSFFLNYGINAHAGLFYRSGQHYFTCTMISLKNHLSNAQGDSLPYLFQCNCCGLVCFNYKLREFLLSSFAHCIEFRCQSTQLMQLSDKICLCWPNVS